MTRRSPWTAAALGAVLALAAAGARATEGKEPFGLLTLDAVERMLGQPSVVVVDANHEDVFRRNHLPGAVLMTKPLAKVLPSDRGRTLVFYCASPS